MNQNQLTFSSQNLVVDYISFKFQNLHFQQTEIANYLGNLGFNVYQESGKSAKPIKEEILIDSKNQYESWFVKDSLYWDGTLLHFSGINAARFYSLTNQNIIDWKIFDTAVLSRFDLYLKRELKETDRISPKDFLSKCQQEIKQKNKNINLEKNQKGWILKIGNRRSNNYSRIYEGKNSLKFEHEMKGKFLRAYHLWLVQNDFQKLEHKLSSHFFVYFGKLLPLQYPYLDWLVVKLRPIQNKLIYKNSFQLDYIQSEIHCDPKKFITFLQFLNYAQSLDYEMKELENIPYRVVTFRLRDFLVIQNEANKDSQYQMKKLKDFFDELQKGFLITSFSDNFFQSLVAVPYVRIEKNHGFLIGKVWLVNELFYYSYPFCLPNFFNTKLNTDQFQVRFKFVQVFNSIPIEKVFHIQEFLDSYSSVISNQRKTKIKRYFLDLVQELKENDLIEPDYKIISDGSFISVNELTISNTSNGFVLYKKLSI